MAAKPFPAEWGLTKLEAAYLTALRPGAVVPIEAFKALHETAVPDARVRKVLASVRRKLDPFNIEINTKWGEGWILDRAARARLNSLMSAA